MATIRENPLHSPALPGVKPPTAQTFGAPAQMAARVKPGGMNSYLGHFAAPQNLMAGHNKGAGRSNVKEHSKDHPGFQALVRRGVPAGALANAARNASPAAKRRNPRLKRVK